MAMVNPQQKTLEACELVVMGLDRDVVHELRIAMMTVLEGLTEDATGEIQVSDIAKRIIGETPPALMQERFLDGLDVLDIADVVLDVVEEEG